MTDKEFRKLRRSALIEIIYEYQRREKEMQSEIEALKEQLSARELKISEAGSIAEAVVKLNELFETAQKTADEYIMQVKRKCDAEASSEEETAMDVLEQNAAEESISCQTKNE